MATARENYEAIAKKLSQTAHYPGNWLYETWSESDLKEFLDERGIPVPQPSTRDKLIASVRRNARLASVNMQTAQASASSSAKAAKESLSDAVFDAWSDSQIKEWADKNGIKVPQGTKRNELLVLSTWSESRLKAFLDARGVPVPQGGKKDELVAAARLNKHKAASGYSAWTFDTWSTENLK